MITFKDFERLELRTGKVKSAEKIPDTKLVKMQIDIGTEVRQLVAGGGLTPEDLLGKNVVVVVNLEPKMLRGNQSNGMILAADIGDNQKPIILTPAEDVPPGTKIR